MARTSPRWPLLGIALVWTLYALLGLLRPEAPEEACEGGEPRQAVGPQPRLQLASEAGREPAGPGRRPAPRAREKAAGGAPEEAPIAGPDARAASRREPAHRLGAEDERLLEILSEGSDAEVLAALEAFVAEHRDHALGRAALIGRLLAPGAGEAEIRPHVEALQALMPEMGFPDLLMAMLELRSGRRDIARGFLFDAARKDLSWLPESELMRLKIWSDLDAGAPPLEVLGRAFEIQMPFLGQVRTLVMGFLSAGERGGEREEPGPGDAQQARLRSEEARAILRIGEAMLDHGATIIENLVGAATVNLSCDRLEKAGGLTEEHRGARARSRAMREQVRLITDAAELVLLGSPDLVPAYLEDLAEYGELRASRRAMMAHLTGELDQE